MRTKPRKRSRSIKTHPRSESVEAGASTGSAVAREATIAAADSLVVPKSTGVVVPLPLPRIQDRAEALLQLHRISDFLKNPPKDPLVRENQALRDERAIILDKLAVAEREAHFFKTRWEDAHTVVHFRSLEKPKEDDFCLELSKRYTYDDVVGRVAQQLGLDDPSKIRLTPHNWYSQQPKPQPIKYRGVDNLADMLYHNNQISDILYYEVLDIHLPELQCLKTLKVAFHNAMKDEVVVHSIRLPRNSTVGDMINNLKAKVKLSHPDSEIRLLEVFCHKIFKIFQHSERIENVNDQYWTLRAEEILEEEKNLGPHDRLIPVYHFTKDSNQNQMHVQNFGDPFVLAIHEGETLAEIKVRIQKKLQVPDEDFSKWKFAVLKISRPEYLEDSDVVSSRFQREDVYGAWEHYLGLEHADTAPKKAYTANQNRHTFEKPVKIYN